ncbi:MAG: hypothetical protein V8T86_11115 [Victivallis sp.]
MKILNRFLIRRVDCVVISWVDEESNADLRKQFGRCGIPIINIRNREPDFDYSAAISFDEGQVMRQILRTAGAMRAPEAVLRRYRGTREQFEPLAPYPPRKRRPGALRHGARRRSQLRLR